MEKVTSTAVYKDGPIIDTDLINSANYLIGAGGKVLDRIRQELGVNWQQSNLIYRTGDNNKTCVLGNWSFSVPSFPSFPYDYYFLHDADISETINRWVRDGQYFETSATLVNYTPQDFLDLLSDKPFVCNLSGSQWDNLSENQQQLILTEKRRYRLPQQSLTIEGTIVNYDRLHYSLSLPLTIIDGTNSDLLLDQIMVLINHLPFDRNSSDPKSKDSLLLSQFAIKDQIELVTYILNGLAGASKVHFV